MATSDVQIANYALTLLGAKRINALSEDTNEARNINAVFGLIRESCLSEHEWNFAIKRANLGLLSDTPEFDFDYKFQLPNDCVRVVKTDLPKGSRYQIEGREILCDSETLKIKYIQNVTDAARFSAPFVKYFAYRLAEEVAYPITGSKGLEADLFQKAEAIKNSGFGLDSVEGIPDEPLSDEWNSIRY